VYAPDNATATVAAVLADPRLAAAPSVAMVAALYGAARRVWAPPLGTGAGVLSLYPWRTTATYDTLPTAAQTHVRPDAFWAAAFKLKSAVRGDAGLRSGRCGSHLFANASERHALPAVLPDGLPLRACGYVSVGCRQSSGTCVADAALGGPSSIRATAWWPAVRCRWGTGMGCAIITTSRALTKTFTSSRIRVRRGRAP
jgi:hypothetical protein